jgi:acyl carrier protein
METGSTKRVLEIVWEDCGTMPTPEKRLDELGFDSLEFMCLVKDIEQVFEIQIYDNDIIHLNTVADLASCVDAKRAASLLPN